MGKQIKYGCSDYREEQALLSMRIRLKEKNLSKKEIKDIKLEIKNLEKSLGLD